MTKSEFELIHNGYTSDGIYYEVSVIEAYDISALNSINLEKNITVTITFYGKIKPPNTYYHSLPENGISYSGILSLFDVQYLDGNTKATYKGTVYAS